MTQKVSDINIRLSRKCASRLHWHPCHNLRVIDECNGDAGGEPIDYEALARLEATRESAALASVQGVYDDLPNPIFAFELLLQQTVNSYELAIAIKHAIESPKYAPRDKKGGLFSADPLTVECINQKPIYHKPDHFALMKEQMQYVDKAVTCYDR